MTKTLTLHSTKGVNTARRFAFNALSLIAVGIFMRTVGVAFNAYLANRAGGEVMGLYSLLFGVYGLALTLGSAGINLGTTRMVADVMGEFCPEGDASVPACKGDICRRAIRRVMKKCLTYSLLCSVGTGLLMLTAAPWIGRVWLGDGRTVLSLQVLALTLPPIAVCACLGGYFTAVRRVVRTSAVGIGVQFIRIGFLYLPIDSMAASRSGNDLPCLSAGWRSVRALRAFFDSLCLSYRPSQTYAPIRQRRLRWE